MNQHLVEGKAIIILQSQFIDGKSKENDIREKKNVSLMSQWGSWLQSIRKLILPHGILYSCFFSRYVNSSLPQMRDLFISFWYTALWLKVRSKLKITSIHWCLNNSPLPWRNEKWKREKYLLCSHVHKSKPYFCFYFNRPNQICSIWMVIRSRFHTSKYILLDNFHL